MRPKNCPKCKATEDDINNAEGMCDLFELGASERQNKRWMCGKCNYFFDDDEVENTKEIQDETPMAKTLFPKSMQRLKKLKEIKEICRKRLEEIRERKEGGVEKACKDTHCPKCSAFYIPFKKDFKCPSCNEPINEFYDIIPETISLMASNKKEYGKYKPDDWPITTFLRYVQRHVFSLLDLIEENNFNDGDDFIKFAFRKDNWVAPEYERKHIEEIALFVFQYLQKEKEERRIEKIRSAKTGEPITLSSYGVVDKNGKDTGKRFARKEDAKEYLRQQNQDTERSAENKNGPSITILGEELKKEFYPKLYQWAKDNPATLESQLKSIAEKWHEGSIGSAMQALESDL